MRRVIRRIDSWTVLRLSFLFFLCLFVVVMVAGVLLWTAANRLGVFDDIAKFMESIGFKNFEFRGSVILRASLVGGLVLVLLGTAGSVIAAILYNLISDVVGGIELVMLEEDLSPRPAASVPSVQAVASAAAASPEPEPGLALPAPAVVTAVAVPSVQIVAPSPGSELPAGDVAEPNGAVAKVV